MPSCKLNGQKLSRNRNTIIHCFNLIVLKCLQIIILHNWYIFKQVSGMSKAANTVFCVVFIFELICAHLCKDNQSRQYLPDKEVG